MKRQFQLQLTGFYICLVCFVTGSVVFAQSENQKVDFRQFDSSLDFVPEDASFYWSTNNNSLKWKAIVNSQAFKEFSETRVAKALWNSFQDGFRQGLESELDDDDLDSFKSWFQSTDGQDTIAVLKDLVSDEFFVFGDEHWSDALARTMSFYGKAFQYGMANPNTDDEDVQRIIWQMASEEFADAEIPAVVMGGRLSNVDQANRMLEKLFDTMVAEFEKLPAEADFLKSALKKVESTDGFAIVLNLDGEKIPWEAVAKDWEVDANELQQIKSWWKGKTISLSLRVQGKYLMFGSAPDENYLAKLGTEKTLVESGVFAPMRKFRDRKLSSVAYLSNEFVARASDSTNIGEYYSNMIKGVRAESDDFDGNIELANAIESDLEEFSKDLKQFFPEPGAYLSFSFLTDEGIEGYSYDWSENISFDGTKPLTILEHVDGNPAILVATRSKDGMKEYAFIEKYVKRLVDRVIEFAPDSINEPTERDVFVETMGKMRSFLSDLNRTNKEKLLPALKDGQSAFIVDFKMTKESWFGLMPPADEPLPIPAFAFLAGISDSELFKDAMRDYFAIADSVIDALKELPDSNIPDDFAIPRPEQESIEDGTMYFYSIPPDLGLAEEIVPNMSLNREIVIVSLAQLHSRKLLAPTPLTVGGPLEDYKRPLMLAIHYDNRATIDAFEKWGRYLLGFWLGFGEPEDFSLNSWSPQLLTAMLEKKSPRANRGLQDEDDMSGDDMSGDDMSDLDPPDFIEFGEKTVALLKCFESYTAAGYLEDDAKVTHFLYRFSDVERD